MKHVFIVNPFAGIHDDTDEIRELLKKYDGTIDYEVYRTATSRDATSYVRKMCETHPDTDFRFYACGGDGTINEVMQGIIGQNNASMSVYPCGSGNDLVKCMGGRDAFLDLDRLFHAEEQMIDVMKVDDQYSINVINFGFDTMVCETMIRVKHKKLIGGKNAYTFGVVTALLRGMKSRCHVEVDGVPLNADRMLLCTVANGQYVGGAFRCAPRSSFCDGVLDVCLMDCISRIKFVKLVNVYKEGKHLDDPRFCQILHYRVGSRIEVTAEDDRFAYCLDGDIIHSKHFFIEVIPKAIRFAVPAPVTEGTAP